MANVAHHTLRHFSLSDQSVNLWMALLNFSSASLDFHKFPNETTHKASEASSKTAVYIFESMAISPQQRRCGVSLWQQGLFLVGNGEKKRRSKTNGRKKTNSWEKRKPKQMDTFRLNERFVHKKRQMVAKY